MLEWHVLGLVLVTALSRALWNAGLEITGDRIVALALTGASCFALGLVAAARETRIAFAAVFGGVRPRAGTLQYEAQSIG